MGTWKLNSHTSWIQPRTGNGRWRLLAGLDGRHLQFVECPATKTSVPLTSNDVLPVQTIMSPILAQGLPSSFLRFCPYISPCPCTWAAQILWDKHTQSTYRADSCTCPHSSQSLQPTSWSHGISSVCNRQSDVAGTWSHWATFWSTTGPPNVVIKTWMKHMWITMQQANIHLLVVYH